MVKNRKEVLLERDRFELGQKSGGGVLSYEAWGFKTKNSTTVTRYNLAYINHAIFCEDNGRVLGFDNAHGFHHRHRFGVVEAIEFQSYEATLERFQREWTELIAAIKRK